MHKNFVLDTNVLLYDPKAIFRFAENTVLIPIEVIEEIDEFKHDVSERGRNSRTIAQTLDGLRARARLAEGVMLDGGGMLKVVCGRHAGKLEAFGVEFADRVTVGILATALAARSANADEETVVVSKNVHLRLKADALGIPACDYDADRSPDPDLYSGWHTLETAAAGLDRLLQGGALVLDGFAGAPNEYVFLRAAEDADKTALGRLGGDGAEIVPLAAAGAEVVGIAPLNLEQIFALDALLDDSIRLITLTGKAGTGKTLLAVAAGLHKVFAEDRYHRLLVFRPTLPVSRDIGFLPGDVQEKMRPWMQPVYDALELVREQDKRSVERCLPPDLMECEEISIEPLTYIRGRSIPHQYIIIDEAQNLTPLEVKTVITRVGRGTKIVLTGDPHQIDNPYIDSLSNGLTYLVDKFRGSVLSAHICLVKGERSELAETAANLL